MHIAGNVILQEQKSLNEEKKTAKLHVKFYETDRPKGVIIISHGIYGGAQNMMK